MSTLVVATFARLLWKNGCESLCVGPSPAFSASSPSGSHRVLATGASCSSNRRGPACAYEYLDLEPYALLVPIGLGSQAKILNTSTFDHDSSQPSRSRTRFRGSCARWSISSRITGTRRYLFANPAVVPAMVVAFLQESGQGPYLEQQTGWRIEGTEWKVRIDAKAQMHDPKGAVTSDGTA